MKILIDQEFKGLMPPLSEEEYELLEKSIVAEGCRDAIVTWHQYLIDGFNRYAICLKHNLPYKTCPKTFSNKNEAKEWIIRNQLARRNLLPHERIRLALLLKPTIEEKAEERMKAGKANPVTNSAQGRTRKKVAEAAGVSEDTIRKSEIIEKEASPEVKEAVRKGKMSVNKAYKQTRQPKSKTAPEGKVTAKHVEKVVEEMTGPKEPEAKPSKNLGVINPGDSEILYKLKNNWDHAIMTDRKKFIKWLHSRKELQGGAYVENN